MLVNCDYCGAETNKRPSMIKKRKHLFCSVPCYAQWQSENNIGSVNPRWNGGKWFHEASGYIYCSTNGGADIPEHRKIAEIALGRPLTKLEIVHHINGDKVDNRHCNLLVCTKGYHHWLHNRMASLYMKEHFSRRLGEQSSLNNSLNSGKPKSDRYGNPEPSRNTEGVETVQGVSYMDKETVQPTNEQSVAKVIDGKDARCAFIGNT